ncbi:MAG: hypothetical protein WB555_02795, partial [Candidatus Korobacteraceae bacterium]
MDLQERDSAGEITRLQHCINDLISLLALPAVWSGNEPTQIVHTLLDALLRMLRLDFVFARWEDPVTRASMEVLRVADSCKLKAPPQDIGGMLSHWLERQRDVSLPPAQHRFEEQGISIFSVPLGVQGEIGIIVVGSERTDFPGQGDSLLL